VFNRLKASYISTMEPADWFRSWSRRAATFYRGLYLYVAAGLIPRTGELVASGWVGSGGGGSEYSLCRSTWLEMSHVRHNWHAQYGRIDSPSLIGC